MNDERSTKYVVGFAGAVDAEVCLRFMTSDKVEHRFAMSAHNAEQVVKAMMAWIASAKSAIAKSLH